MAEEIKTNDLQDMFPGLIQTGFTQTEDGQLQYNVDIVDEAFNTGKSPTEIISLLRTTDNKVINTPEYYKYKYASDTHPTPYTPEQIDAAIDNAAKAIALDKHYTDLGISLSQVQLYQSIEDISANHNVYMNTPTFARMGSETYLGFYNPISGKQSEFITEQMFAERMPYMIDARGGGYEKIAKPTLNEMYNMFGKGKAVVATTQDMQTGQPVLIAYDPDTFVPRDRQYSTKHGAQQMFGSGTSAFFGGIKSGLFASTGQSFIGMAQWLNDASRYDKSYLHSLGPDAVDAHIDELMSALVDQGLYGVADKLQELKGTYDVDKLNEVFNYAYSKLDYITGTNLRNKAQPIDWVKHNKNLEKIWNRLDNSKSRTDLMHERGSGALNAIVNSGETIGMIGSQIVIAYLTAGAGSLLPAGSTAAGIVGMTGRVLSMFVGTSQAVGSEFVREGIEAGIDREDLAKMVLYALPVVTLTEYGTQGYMFKGAERTMKAKFLKEVVSPELKSFASKFAGKKATDQQIKEFTKGYLKKIFANPTFQKIMDSGIVEYGKAIMYEELQENLEELLYNIIKKNYDSRLAPEFYETGHGKWGTRYLTDNMAENFEGVFYATAITQGVSMMLPRMLRGKMGLPTHTNNDQKLRYQALRSALVNPEETYRQAYEEFSKPDGGVFGDKSVTIEHASHGNVANDEYRVPSNPVLQKLGFEEGAPISSLSEMHFIEFIETVHSYANMIENMGLNEIDKSILASAGFDHDISLADAVDTFEKLSNIGEAIQELERENNTTVKDILDKVEHNKNLQEGETEQAITSEEQEILRLHNESLVAKKRLDYYGQMEEDTGHSAAVNDIVKRERAIISKVRAEMSRLHNIDEIDQKMKNDPEITKLYLDTYEKVANRTMRYNHIKLFLELLNTDHLRIAVQKKEMAERLEGEEAFKNMDKGLSSLLERLGDVVAIDEKGNRSLVSDTDFNINNDQLAKLVEDIEAFEQGYMAHLVNKNSTISMDQLSSLNEKYSQFAESADFMIGELIKGSETLFNENIQRSIQEMMSKDQSLIDNIVQLQEQNNQLRENLNTEIAELQTQIEDIKAKISALPADVSEEERSSLTEALNELEESLKDKTAQLDAIASDEDVKSTAERDYLNELGGVDEFLGDLQMTNISQYDKLIALQERIDELENSDVALLREFNTGKKGTITVSNPDGSLSELSRRTETQEEFDQRISDRIKHLKETGNAFDTWLKETAEQAKEIEEFIDAFLSGDMAEFRSKYPYSYLSESNIRQEADEFLDQLKNFDSLEDVFDLSKYVVGDQKFNEHATKLEKDLLPLLAERDADNKNHYEEIFHEVKTAKDRIFEKLGKAKQLSEGRIAHSNTILREGNISSIRLLIAEGITGFDNDFIALSERFMKGTLPISEDIILAAGNYTVDQEKMLAQREKLFIEMISYLQHHKDIVFNNTNKDSAGHTNRDKVFSVFDSYFRKTSTSVFQGSEINAHLGLDKPITTESRLALIPVERTTEDGKKIIIGEPLLNMDYDGTGPKYGHELATMDKAPGASESIATKTDVVRMALREHFQVLSWIESGVSLESIMAIRSNLLEMNELISTAEQEANENSIVSFITSDPASGLLNMLAGHVYGIPNYYSATEMKAKAEADAKGKPLHRASDEVDGIKLTFVDFASNIMSIGGDAGVGKTVHVMPRALKIIDELVGRGLISQHPIKKITMVGITKHLRELHKEAIKGNSRVQVEYIAMDNGTDGFLNLIRQGKLDTSDGHLYIVDEASVISRSEFHGKDGVLGTEHTIKSVFNGTKAKAIMMGDIFQMRSVDTTTQVPFVMVSTVNSHLMTEQFSSRSQLLRQLAEIARNSINKVGSSNEVSAIPWARVAERIDKNGKKLGARFFNNTEEVWQSFEALANGKVNTERAILFATEEHLEHFITTDQHMKARTPEQVKALRERIKELRDNGQLFISFRNVSGNTENMIQGLREKEVYVMYSQYSNTSATKGHYPFGFKVSASLMGSSFYTAISRASQWVGIPDQAAVQNGLNTDEQHAASIGIEDSELNEFNQRVAEQRAEKEAIRFKELGYKISEAKPTDEAKKEKRTGVFKQRVGDQDYDFDYNYTLTRRGDVYIIDLTHQGKALQADIPITESEDTIRQAVESLLAEHIEAEQITPKGYQEPKSPVNVSGTIKPVDPSEGGTFEHKGETFSEGTSIVVDGSMDGTIQEVTTDGQTIEVIISTSENKTERITLSPANTVVKVETVEEVDAKEVGTKNNTISVNRWQDSRGNNDGHETHWASSATLALPTDGSKTSYTPEEKIVRRAINDAVMRAASDGIIKLTASRKLYTYQGDAGTGIQYSIVLEIGDDIIDNIEKVFKGTSVEKLFSFVNSNISNQEKWEKLKELMHGNVVVGVLSDIKVPDASKAISIEKGRVNISRSSILNESAIDDVEAAKNTVKTLWNDYINKVRAQSNAVGVVDALIDEMNMNIALVEQHYALQNGDVEVTISTRGRRIEYAKNTHTKVLDLVNKNEPTEAEKSTRDTYPEVQFDKAPTGNVSIESDNSRKRLTISLHNNDTINLVVRMPYFPHDKIASQVMIKRIENDLSQPFADTTSVDAINLEFASTNIFKLLKENGKAVIDGMNAGGNPFFAELKKYIQYNVKGNRYFFDLRKQSNYATELAASKGMTKEMAAHVLDTNSERGDILRAQDNFGRLSQLFLDNLKKGTLPFYDFLEFAGGQNRSLMIHEEYHEHGMNDILDVLYTNATSINNNQFDVRLPIKGNPADAHTKPKDTGKTTRKGRIFESVEHASPATISLQEGIERVRKYLGDSFIDSGLFVTQDGYIIKPDGSYATGSLTDNILMTIAMFNGRMRATSVEHEPFHLVYRNFISPEAKGALAQAAEMIAKVEGTFNPDEDIEEWMARDFAQGERVLSRFKDVSLSDGVTLWERFKNFMKGLLNAFRDLFGLRTDIRLVRLYDQIRSGEFVDMVESLSLLPGEVAYESADGDVTVEGDVSDTVTQMSNLSDDASLKNMAANNMANKIRRGLINQMRNSTSILRAEAEIRANVLHGSLYGNILGSSTYTFSEAIHAMIESSGSIAEDVGSEMVTINDGGTLRAVTVKEVVDNNMENQLSTTALDNTLEVEDVSVYIDFYRIFSDPVHTVALTQLMLPKFDLITGMAESKTGPNWHYDWSRIKEEDYINSMQKFYLSSIPLIDVHGNIVPGHGVYLNYKTVSDILKSIGSHVSNIIQNNKFGFQEELQDLENRLKDPSLGELTSKELERLEELRSNNAIDKFTLFRTYMEGVISDAKHDGEMFTDMQSTYIHSIYNYMFGERAPKGVESYALNYGSVVSTVGNPENNRYVGLLQKAELMRKDYLRTTNETTRKELGATISQMNGFLSGIVGLYSSYYVQDKLKFVFYNDREGYVKMRAINYEAKHFKDTANKIRGNQEASFMNDRLNDATISLMKNNVIIATNLDGGTIHLKVNGNTVPLLAYGATYKHNVASYRFKFVGIDGNTVNTYKGGQTGITNPTVLKERYHNLITGLKYILPQIGLGAVLNSQGNVLESLLVSQSWESVLDILDDQAMADDNNFIDIIKKNYNTPIDFFADYVGALLSLYKVYATDINQTIRTKEGLPITAAITMSEFITIKAAALEKAKAEGLVEKDATYDMERLVQDIDKAQSAHHAAIVERFIHNSTPPQMIRYEMYNESTEDGEEEYQAPIRFIRPEDMFASLNAVASIINKLSGFKNTSFVYNADGHQTSRSALEDSLNNILKRYKYSPKHLSKNHIVGIDGFVNSLGISRNLGFVSYGTSKVVTSDYIQTSISLFMQELRKGRQHTVLMVPIMPASDTGKMIFARTRTNMVQFDGRHMRIDYKEAAKGLVDVMNTFKERHRQSLVRLSNTLEKLRALGITQLPAIPEYTNTQGLQQFIDPIYLSNQFIKMSLEAHKKGVWDEFNKVMTLSNLTKDMKAITDYEGGIKRQSKTTLPNFDITLQQYEGKDVWVPGKGLMAIVDGYDFLFRRHSNKEILEAYGLTETNRLIIDDLALLADNTKKVKDRNALYKLLVSKIFFNKIQQLASMMAKNEFVQPGSMVDLERMATSQTSTAASKYGDKSYYSGSQTNPVINQPLLAFYMTTFFASQHLGDMGIGSQSFTDFYTQVKRIGSMTTPGQNLLVNSRNIDGTYMGSVPQQSPLLFYNDLEVDSGQVFKASEDGSPVLTPTTTKDSDGRLMVNALMYRFVQNSLDSDHGVIGTSHMYKGLNNYVTSDGFLSQVKRADHVITGTDMQSAGYFNMQMNLFKQSDMLTRQRLIEEGAEYLYNDKKLSLYDRFRDLWNNRRDLNFSEIIEKMYQDIIELQYENGEVSERGVRAYEAVVNSLVYGFAPLSTQKGIIQSYNQVDPYSVIEDQLGAELQDNESLKIILDPSQDVTTQKLQTFPSQQESLMSYTDNAQVNQLNNQYGELKRELRNDLTKAWLDKISSQTDLAGKKVDKGDQFKDIDWTTESYDKIDMSTKKGREKAKRLDRALEQLWVYLRSEGANAISLSGQDTAYRDLLEDHATSEQLPMLRQKLIDIHINQINKTMQGRTTGVRLTQTSGVATEYYVKNGVTYTKNDILNILYEDGYRSVPLEVYGSQELADRIAQAGYELRTLDAMTIDQDGNTRSGTTMIPNIFADIFGHKSNETLYEILSVPSDNPASRERVMINKGLGRHFLDLLKSKDFTTFGDESHVRAFLEAPNVRTAIRSLKLYEKTNKFIEGLQARIDQDDPEAALEYSNYMANVLVKENPSDLDLLIGKLKADAANNDYRMANDIAEKTVELTDVFKKSLEMFVSRVPANAISSGAVLETVAFHDGGSSIYIPLWMTKVSDSDFDIDALTAYANDLASIVEGGQTQASKIRNEMNSIFKSLVKHPSNQIALFNEMEISDIKRVGNENAESATKGASYNTFDSFIDAYSRNKAGDGAIGVLANTQTSLTYILANATGIGGNSKVVATGLLRQIIDTNSDAKHGILKMGMGNFITRIGAWGQASYDNAKENVFGNYGISEKHVNMLGVMVGLGWTNERIKDFFNNPYVKELLDEHTLSAKMIPGQHEKNLYILAEDRSNELIQTFNQTITSRLKYTKETIQDEDKVKGLKEASQSTISSMADTQYQEAEKVLIERLKQVYGNQTMQKTYWFQEGIDMQVELERWKEHVKYNDGELQMKNINSEEFFDQIKRFFEGHEEAFNLYKNYLRSSVELKNLADLKEGQSLIRMIPELHVTASALFRTSQILKLRNGLSVKSFEFSQDKALVEQAIGMSLEDFMSYSSNSVTRNPNDITKHMQFFVKNNNEFISAALEGTLSTEMKNRANRLYEIEEKIAREFNIAQFISNMPQFKGLLERFYNEYKMRSNMFIVDHFVSEGVIKEFLGLQGMANVSFRQQQSKLQDIFVEMAIDRYYNNIGNAAIEGSLLLPVKTDRGYQSQSDRYDLKNVLDRNNFQDAFPEWFNALLMNSNNFEYLQAMLPKESQEEIYKLMRNPLLPLLYISSRYNQVMLNVNTVELNPYLLQKYQDAFKALPETLISLMFNNEIIRNKMSYRKGSIMQVIGVDYYKGAISTAFESMIKDLNEIGTSEGFLTSEMRNREGQYAISFDRDIKHQIFDHLGHEADLASYMKKPFPANGYTYKYGYSFNEKGKRVHYRYLDGRYQEYYRTSYGISLIDNLMSEVPVFKANPDDINQLKNNSTATMTHYTGPVYSMPAVGSVVMTQTGELVYVKSVKPGMFTYRKASDAEIQSMRDALVKKQQNENNMIILQENTLQHYLISPTSVSFDKSKIDAHRLAVPENVKFQTIDSKGNEVMIDVFKGIKDFENIQEGLNTFVANVLSTIDSKRSYIEGYLEQLKNGDRTAEQLDGTLNTIVRGLYKDAQQTTEKAGQTHQQMQHDLQQIRLAAAFIANTRPAVLRHMFRQKIATYLSNPLDPIGNRIPDSHARDNIRSIIVNNNKVHGLENLTIGFSTETEKPQQITYMGVFKSVINEHFGNVMNYTTDLDKTVQRHSTVQSSEDIFAMHSDKALEIYKLKKLVPLQPNTMTPEELRNKVEEQNRDVSLSEDGTHYKQGENIYARSSNLNESLDQRLSGSIFYEMTQEEIDALDSESLKRGEKSERIRKHALEVGSQADAFSRKYLALFFDKVSRGDTSPVVMNMAGYNLIDTYSLRDALNTYANFLVQFAKANNYESIEVITDPVRVYSDQNTESINEYMHDLPKHKDIEYDGYATETDLVVMLKRANQNEYTIFIPDIKTTKAHDLEKVEYQKPIKQADGKIVNITRSTNLSWLIQNELTAKAFTYNFGLSVSGGGIIALTKTNNNTINKELGLGKGVKTKVIFGLPNQIDLLKKQVENDSEYWIKNKAMPWYMPQKPKIYRGKNIGVLDKVLPSVKNTGQIITSDQQSDNNNKLNCE